MKKQLEEKLKERFDDTVINIEDVQINQDPSIIIAGARRTGKSVLAVHLIKHLAKIFDYDDIILISNTAEIEVNGSFDFVNPKKKFLPQDQDAVLEAYFKHQKKLIEKKIVNRVMIVLDDIDLNRKSDYVNKLFTLGRHYYFTVIMLVQYPKLAVSTQIRSNLDIHFLSHQGDEGVDALYRAINQRVGLTNFTQFVEENTQNNQFVVFSRFDKERKIRVVKAVFHKLKTKYNEAKRNYSKAARVEDYSAQHNETKSQKQNN